MAGVAAADPHGLITMLMDGALQRLSAARGAIDHGATESKGRLIHRVVEIIDELRASLNFEARRRDRGQHGGSVRLLSRLLMRANLESRADLLDEAGHLPARDPQCVDPDSGTEDVMGITVNPPAAQPLAGRGCNSVNDAAGTPGP